MTKAIKLFTTSLFGGLLCIYCTAFMWLEVPELFFQNSSSNSIFLSFFILIIVSNKRNYKRAKGVK